MSGEGGVAVPCQYEFEHDCNLANCEDLVTALQSEFVESPGWQAGRYLLATYAIGTVALYSSIGMWLGIWNNYAMTGLALVGGAEVFCDEVDTKDGNTFCARPTTGLTILLIIVGIALSTFAGSLLANGQVAAPEDPLFSRVEGLWQSVHLRSKFTLFLRGVLACMGQIASTCGFYYMISNLVLVPAANFYVDFSVAVVGMAGFTSIVVYFEYYAVGKSIDVMAGEGTHEENRVLGVNLPQPVQVVHLSTLLDTAPSVVLEPWEEAYTAEEVREELIEQSRDLPGDRDTGRSAGGSQNGLASFGGSYFSEDRQGNYIRRVPANMRHKVNAIMKRLQARAVMKNIQYALLSVTSLFLQACCWLGCDRVTQIWLFPGAARDAGGQSSAPFAFSSSYPTALHELFFMAFGLVCMIASGSFLCHACVVSTRNVAADYETTLSLCGLLRRPIVLDRTVGPGLALSWLVEFSGIVGNFLNLSGAWFLLDEHLGLPQTTARNIALTLFALPLLASGGFFNDAGIELGEDDRGGVAIVIPIGTQGGPKAPTTRYLGQALQQKMITSAVDVVGFGQEDEDEEEEADFNPDIDIPETIVEGNELMLTPGRDSSISDPLLAGTSTETSSLLSSSLSSSRYGTGGGTKSAH